MKKLRQIKEVDYDRYVDISSLEKLAAYAIKYLDDNGISTTWTNLVIATYYLFPRKFAISEEFIDFIEFDADTSDQEKTLLRIYKKDKIWNGNLNFLIKNLNYNVDNRAIPEDLIVNRINCGQRCQENGNCKNCINALAFSNAIRGYKSYLK